MSDHVGGIGQVKEQEPADDRIERLVVDERARLALAERHVVQICLRPSILGCSQLRRVAVDASDRPIGTNELRHLERDVAWTRTKVEHSHPRNDAATLQQ